MRIAITGARGQLGQALLRVVRAGATHDAIALGREDLDITDLGRVRRVIRDSQADAIIHAAAFTNVDECERAHDLAFKVNALGARNVAIAAREVGAKFCHISTDYVFDGTKQAPYREYDAPNPINVYGLSKLLGERLVKEQLNRFFVVRTSWLYGLQGKNFVGTMLGLADEGQQIRVVDDQRGSPTFADDLAKQIVALVETDLYGTYHATGAGECNWYEFALEILGCAGYVVRSEVQAKVGHVDRGLREVSVTPVSTAEFPRPAKRPAYSVLDNYMLRLEGLNRMRDWRESLAAYFDLCRGERGGS